MSDNITVNFVLIAGKCARTEGLHFISAKFLENFADIVATVAIRCSVLSLCQFLPRNGIGGLSFVLTSLILA